MDFVPVRVWGRGERFWSLYVLVFGLVFRPGVFVLLIVNAPYLILVLDAVFAFDV